MISEIDNFKLKIKNTQRLKRNYMQFSLAEAKALDNAIDDLQTRIDKLEVAALQSKTLTVDIVGRDF